MAGLGRAGRSAARRLTHEAGGVSAAWADAIGPLERDATVALEAEGVAVRVGGDPVAVLDRSPAPRTVVASPGLPDDHPLLRAARARGLVVLDESEVGWRLDARPWIAVTGTNGKSTTVRLLAALLQASGVEPVLGGNTYGAPPLTGLEDGGDVVLAEISSYQLERSEHLLPELAVLTGIGHDHLDRHGTLEHYAAIKRRLMLREDACVPRAAVSVDDPFGRAIAAELEDRGAAVRTFGLAAEADVRGTPLDWDLDCGRIGVRDAAGERVLDTRLPGPHNAANLAGALAVAELLGLDRATVDAAVAETPAPVGRCTRIDVGAPFDVMVDFAKNPSGFATATATARAVADRRGGHVLVVLSASPADDVAGLEAKGRAAAAEADVVVVTTERWEDVGPLEPPPELVRGAAAGGAEVEVVAVRRSALIRAAALARPGDVLAIVGRSPAPRPQVDADGRTERFDDAGELSSALALPLI